MSSTWFRPLRVAYLSSEARSGHWKSLTRIFRSLLSHPLRPSLWEVSAVSHRRRVSFVDDATKVVFVVVLAVTLLVFWVVVQLLSNIFPSS